ncbi:hypothetical protein CHS0354_022387 [Potamilus streckersoni]|uniref:SSD domain-containing protein n=1 Tax=Potamilus streckersoni TaxID=2493646 RepID=A0AAE0W370_9BIVA|nr:hypothetical protein CHS0354_022387 [Potamilus streckersoni]
MKCLTRISNGIIGALETSFYRVGQVVAGHPVATILLSVVACGLCGIGLYNFQETTDDAKLWVPQYSRVLPEKKWVNENFPEETRITSFIITSDNVLSTSSVNAILDIYLKSKEFTVTGGHSLETMCLKVGRSCRISSILELWSFNETIIRSLTSQEILQTVNNAPDFSPVYGMKFDLSHILSGVSRDENQWITGAQATSMVWVLDKKGKWNNAALEWEKKMIDFGNGRHLCLREVHVYATRTFDDEGYGAVKADTSLLIAGFSIVFVFVIVVLGRISMVEHKLYVSIAGILTIGLAILFAYGIAMVFGVMYGPVHALMPFLLLGIGVDDMFIIVEEWRNLTKEDQKLELKERIARALKHSGVSVTVTSVTDIVAFGIGATTVIPGLSAFCIYAAIGIFALYMLVATFFVAVLTLDEKRIEQSRDGLMPCCVHKNYTPNRCSQKNFCQLFMQNVFGPVLMKFPVKITVILVTCALVAVNCWSFTLMKQDFDLYNYIPTDSYARDYVGATKMFFPSAGDNIAVYCDSMNYFHNKLLLEEMDRNIREDPHVLNGSVEFWFTAFTQWLKTTHNPNIRAQLGADFYPMSEEIFHGLVLKFISQPEGMAFGHMLKFHTGRTPPRIRASFIPLKHTRQTSSAEKITAMESLRGVLDGIKFPDGKCFSYGFSYLNNETNKILQEELYRNLALSGACIFVVTLVLIANLWTSLLVFTCVVGTVVDVIGTLQFMEVTIDNASSILIILCVGLAVDYSAHIGHTFMTISGNKDDRAKVTLVKIGPAVINGGFSTFLAFVLLADSNSYGFALFFRVFMSVVVFGLFHGLVYLPVILSFIGPAPYKSASESELKDSNEPEPASTSPSSNMTLVQYKANGEACVVTKTDQNGKALKENIQENGSPWISAEPLYSHQSTPLLADSIHSHVDRCTTMVERTQHISSV